jgi:hypothetical protein
MTSIHIDENTTNNLWQCQLEGTSIEEDQAEEIESYMGGLAEDELQISQTATKGVNTSNLQKIINMSQTLRKAADEIITDSTRNDYEWYAQFFLQE